MPKPDILLNQGRGWGKGWSHKQAQFNSPHLMAKRDPEIPYTPPLTPSSVQASLEASDKTLLTYLQRQGGHYLPKLPITSSDGPAFYTFFLLLKGYEPPMTPTHWSRLCSGGTNFLGI